jgi:hypothetical protein
MGERSAGLRPDRPPDAAVVAGHAGNSEAQQTRDRRRHGHGVGGRISSRFRRSHDRFLAPEQPGWIPARATILLEEKIMSATRLLGAALALSVLFGSAAYAQDSGKKDAKPSEKAAQAVAELSKQADANANADAPVKNFTKEKLLAWCTDPVFVKACTEQNAKKVTLDQIKKLDKEWTDAEQELPIQKEMVSNTCAKEILRMCKELSVVTECFVMDNQGANVGQNVLTSDYWQGDEPKWQESFNNGKGGVHFDKAKLDKSTNQVDQKVGLPIIDENGNVIGAICIGLNVEQVKQAK